MFRLLGIIFIIFVIFGNSSAQTVDPAETFILNPPTVNTTDKRVSFDLVVRKQKYFSVPDLTTANFQISEAHQNLQVTRQPTLPLTLDIIVNLSAGSNDDLIRNTLHAYFDSYYRPGDDTTLYLLNGVNTNIPNVIPVASLQQAREVIDGLRTTRNYYSLTPTFNMVIESLQNKDIGIDHPAHVMLVSSLLSEPREATASRIFATQGYPFHVVQSHINRQAFVTSFRTLANTGAGLYANNRDGAFVLPGDDLTPFIPINTLKVLFDTIDNSRYFYQVRYETLNRDLSQIRNVMLTITLSDGQQLAQRISYEWPLEVPKVEFVDSDDLNPVRRPFRDTPTSETVKFDVSRQNVTVQVSFPDGIQRRINVLRWEVIDRRTNLVIQSNIIQSPPFDRFGRLTIPWSIEGSIYDIPAQELDIQMQVSVTDQLQMTGRTQAEGRVTVFAAPTIPPPTLPPPTPTAVPTLVTTQVASAILDESRVNVNPVALGGLMGILFVMVAILIIAFLRLRRIRGEQEIQLIEMQRQLQLTSQANAQMQTPEKTSEDEQPLDRPRVAQLRVVQIDSEYPIEDLDEYDIIWVNTDQFIVGRSETEECDWVIDADFISPRHCRITHLHNRFYVRDLNSKNGTYVNGEPIISNQDVPVPNGSEIGITRRITIEIWEPDIVLEQKEDLPHYSTANTGRTRLKNELDFKPLPGLSYVGDPQEGVDNDYSPL